MPGKCHLPNVSIFRREEKGEKKTQKDQVGDKGKEKV